jgi:hypothetical protein
MRITSLVRIPEVAGSNLVQETYYPKGFRGFPFSPSRQILGYRIKLSHGGFLPRFYISFVNNHPIIQRYVILATEKVVN